MNWPKLTETLPPAKDMMSCQRCGKECDLARWEEHDEHDQGTGDVIVLCDDCEALIEPHPRLYRKLHVHEPMPGSMYCCLDCPYREKLTCTHPALKRNGGHGLMIVSPEPGVAHVSGMRNGRRFGRWTKAWRGAPDCKRCGLEVLEA